MKKNNKGITLVVLIITIIVMLILAGVTINMAFKSDKGVIGQANNAKNLNTRAEVIEKVKNEFNKVIVEKNLDEEGEKTALYNIIKDIDNSSKYSEDEKHVTINGETYTLKDFDLEYLNTFKVEEIK